MNLSRYYSENQRTKIQDLLNRWQNLSRCDKLYVCGNLKSVGYDFDEVLQILIQHGGNSEICQRELSHIFSNTTKDRQLFCSAQTSTPIEWLHPIIKDFLSKIRKICPTAQERPDSEIIAGALYWFSELMSRPGNEICLACRQGDEIKCYMKLQEVQDVK